MPLKLQRDEQATINLTPMIDIVFLLIIFFMVSTKFSELNEAERDIAISVPSVSNAQALTAAPRKRVINVFSDGSVSLDRQPVALEQLQQELVAARKQYPQLGVVVRGDAETRYRSVASVIAVCRQAEINDLNIAVQQVQRR